MLSGKWWTFCLSFNVLTETVPDITHYKMLENYILENTATSSRGQWVNDDLVGHHVNGSVQDCSISSALAMEILQSCTKPLM